MRRSEYAPTPYPARRHSLLVSVLALALAATGLTGLTPAAAQTTSGGFRDFAERFSVNTTGDIAQFGNALMTCPPSDSRCAGAQNNDNSTVNNSFNMINIDVDADATTFNSSTANLSLPAGSDVLWAGLYWGADTRRGSNGADAADAAARNTVRLQTPTDGYVTVTASQLDSSGANDDTTPYQGFADVTATVRAAGTGTYGVANVQTGTGRDRYAGWSISVVYRDPAQPARNLTVFDGFQEVSRSRGSQTITVAGFQTPPSGPVTTRLGVLAWEGDFGITGDFLELNGRRLSDGNNPSDNFFNSSISNLGTTYTAKNPNFRNQFAVDLDRVNANGILANDATSATITLGTGGDTYRPGTVSFATDLFAPNVEIDKTSEDLNGGEVEPG